MTYTASVYKSGNSKVMTIPVGVPLEIGDVVEFAPFTKKTSAFKMKKKRKNKNKQTTDDLKLLKKIAGSAPGSSMGMNPQEIEKSLEGIYD